MTRLDDNALTQILRQTIEEAQGFISFSQFMNLALYHPTHGYYCTDEMAFGKQGDFTTAPELSPLFAHCFAKQGEQIIHHLGNASILELGAGSGAFARDLLLALKASGTRPDHYFIYEISPALRRKQQALLQDFKITWLDSLPTEFSGIIIANEVLDALPVDCFEIGKEGILERGVSYTHEQFTWTVRPAHLTLKEKLKDLSDLPIGYQSEINLHLESFIASLCQSLLRGVILFADYGYGHLDYYSPLRSRGTLTCFHHHNRHDDPLQLPGQQDITAHVDFTRVIEAASEKGCSLGGYTTQAGFLFSCGLAELAEIRGASLSSQELFQQAQALKVLTLPTEMGERVKVMGLMKGISLPLMGFNLLDKRREL